MLDTDGLTAAAPVRREPPDTSLDDMQTATLPASDRRAARHFGLGDQMNTKRWSIHVSLTVLLPACTLLTVFLVAPSATFAAENGSVRPIEMLHMALNAGDVDGSVQLFSSQAVVIQPRIGGFPQVYVGEDQIRWWLNTLVRMHARWNVVEAPSLVGDRVRWSDSFTLDAFQQMRVVAADITSEAVLADDGRISSLTMVFTPATARSMQLALAPTEGEQSIAPGFGVLEPVSTFGIGLVVGAASIVRWRRRGRSVDASLSVSGQPGAAPENGQ
jgi:hypothetical protein